MEYFKLQEFRGILAELHWNFTRTSGTRGISYNSCEILWNSSGFALEFYHNIWT